MDKSLRKNQLVIEDVKEDFLYHEHFLTPEQLEEVFKTDLKDGLTEEQAAENLIHYGPNALVAMKGDSYWKILRHNLCGWFQCVLWIGAILNFTAYISAVYLDHKPKSGSSEEYLYLGIVISLTVLLTGLFGFYVEAKNIVVMSEFEKMVPASATVIRDGIKMSIPNNLVTIGDIAEMKAGEMVPADICIIECTNFATDTSSLTGESKPVYHSAKFTDPNRLETKNMCFFSSPIIEGSGRGVVVGVGEMTEIGKIACLVTGLEKEETPIAREIARFIKILLYIGIVFGISFFIMVYMVTKNWVAACQYMLGIILANVPEGLIVTLTVCLTLSARHLKTVNCLAKSLQAVETLGSTSCICSDKTGTLTKNQMSVSHIFCNWSILDKDDRTRTSDKTYTDLCTAACLNLRATFAHDTLDLPIKKRKVLGDASETAILKYMEMNRSATVVQAENPKVAEIPFSSATKYQISIHEIKETKSHLLVMKGGPEIVLEYCSNIATTEGLMPITPEISKELKGSLAKLAQMGERVIGYAHLTLAIDQFPFGYKFDTHELNFPLSDLCFLGAISLVDPPRTNIDKYIQLCRDAGIRVVMVTGDHPVTALAISRKCGLITTTTAIDYAFEHHIEVSDIPKQIKKKITAAVITGDDLRKMSSHELTRVLSQYVELSFARTSPQQKLLIVETYQKLGHVVAVTGDGVNDSPALKKADIGIAMGITGTEVSKQAADMILLDDNFASIVKGIEEGRRIFDNLKKTIAYTLTSNTPEMLPFVMYALVGMPLPLTLMLILIINVGTDLLPAMSLAYEASEEDIMKHLPRKSTDHLVTCVMIFMTYFQMGLLQFFAGMFVYFVVFAESGFFPSSLIFVRATWELETAIINDTFGNPWDYNSRKLIERKAQTAYFVAICWTQISDVIVCKTRRVSLITKKMNNHPLNASILIDLIAASAVTYMPIFNELFQTQPLEWYVFFLSVPYAVLMILLDELRRYIIRNNLSKWVTDETYY